MPSNRQPLGAVGAPGLWHLQGLEYGTRAPRDPYSDPWGVTAVAAQPEPPNRSTVYMVDHPQRPSIGKLWRPAAGRRSMKMGRRSMKMSKYWE